MFEFKESSLAVLEATGSEFTGYAAMYGTEDRNGEVISPGAMSRSIRENDGEFPLLWQHNRETPIGVVRLEDTPRGARATARLADTPLAQQAAALLRPPEGFQRGGLRDLSIGYLVNLDEVKSGVRYLKDISIFEVSLVTIGAHPHARVGNVKGDDTELEISEEEQLQMLCLDIQMAGLFARMERAFG